MSLGKLLKKSICFVVFVARHCGVQEKHASFLASWTPRIRSFLSSLNKIGVFQQPVRRAVLIAALILCAPASSFSADGGDDGEREYRFFHGMISGYSGNSIVVNETKKANMTYETKFYDSSGREADAYRLREHRWVYVEGVPRSDGSVDAEKIYLLPGPVNNRNRSSYGFMQSP